MARRRFSIAHELGHFVLSHRPISFRSSSALPAAVHIRIHLAKSFISEMKTVH
ncbi:MAG TPA: ImmA/IrrE family metallo-endopeptidase [Synergistaceae bacterium]|nr:ImmA/IrrE family metallo-endopeptidase [Synergistaceae bacterium]